jgi:hypothetical protein
VTVRVILLVFKNPNRRSRRGKAATTKGILWIQYDDIGAAQSTRRNAEEAKLKSLRYSATSAREILAQRREEVQNGLCESVQYELFARRYADTPIQCPFVVAALPPLRTSGAPSEAWAI